MSNKPNRKKGIRTYNSNNYRTDRVKPSELKEMLRLRKKMSIEEIAIELGRNWRTVKYHLDKEEAKEKEARLTSNPFFLKDIEPHREKILSIAKAMLVNGLDSTKESQFPAQTYTVWRSGNLDSLTEEKLYLELSTNWINITASLSDDDADAFIAHIHCDYPEFDHDNYVVAIRDNPFKVISALRSIPTSWKLVDTCETCRKIIAKY
jgi:hypothetical protein